MKRNKWLSRLDLNQCNDGVKARCLTAWLLDNISCSSVRVADIVAVEPPTEPAPLAVFKVRPSTAQALSLYITAL